MEVYKLVVDENVALKAEVARLKLHNESLVIRLHAARDHVTSLEQFWEGEATARRTAERQVEEMSAQLGKEAEFAQYCKQQWSRVAAMHEELRQELMRRGADDPLKPKPPSQTALDVLQLVRNWDRDVCLEDLRKQRAEQLKRIDVLKLGQGIYMEDVVKGMRQRGSYICDGYADDSLYDVLGRLRRQLWRIYDPTEPQHREWEEYPLSLFTTDAEDNMQE